MEELTEHQRHHLKLQRISHSTVFSKSKTWLVSGLCLITAFILLSVSQNVFAANEHENPRTIAYQNYASNTFVFNPRSHRWKAINKHGKVIRTGRASGGKGYCPDIRRSCRTPTGSYRVISKGGPGCRSSRYPVNRGGAPMPYCMFFSRYYAIHGSPDVPNANASHGCIRVRPSDARWLSNNFVRIGTKVVVKSY